MHVASLVFTAVAALAASCPAHSQTPDKAKPAAEAKVKPSAAPKAAVQDGQAVKDLSKARVEGTASPRTMPAEMKKDDGCHSKGSASDA